MSSNWPHHNTYRDRDTVVTVYRPRPSASPAAWVALAAIVLVLLVGGGTGPSDGSTPPAPSTESDAPTALATASVRAAEGLTVRVQPAHDAAEIGRLPDGTTVAVTCHTRGPADAGSGGTSTVWVHVVPPDTASGYVPAAGLAPGDAIRSQVPAC